MSDITIKGKAKVIKIYNVSRMEIEGLDISEIDLESKEDVRELFELVNDFVDSGEVDAYEPPIEIEGVDPDECVIEIDQKRYYSDELQLKNSPIMDLLASIQESEENELFYIRSFEGDGVWDFEADMERLEKKSVSIEYVDCSLFFDQYDILREGYLDLICDTLLPRTLSVDKAVVEISEFIFHPQQVYGQLYISKKDPVADIMILQKVDFGGRSLVDADFNVDDFEEN